MWFYTFMPLYTFFPLCRILPFFSTIHLPEKPSQFIKSGHYLALSPLKILLYLLWRSYLKSESKCNHLLFCPPITCTYFLLLPSSFCHRMAKFIFLTYLYFLISKFIFLIILNSLKVHLAFLFLVAYQVFEVTNKYL